MNETKISIELDINTNHQRELLSVQISINFHYMISPSQLPFTFMIAMQKLQRCPTLIQVGMMKGKLEATKDRKKSVCREKTYVCM